MPHWNRVTILGVGLIGGSIGLALRQRGLAGRVVGWGRRPESLRTAEELSAIDEGTTLLDEAARDADLVIACAPVQYIPEHLRAAAAVCGEGALLTDVGSTKSEIVRSLSDLPARVRFLAGHPLAGSEKSGPAFAQADLFVGRTVILTPTETTPDEALRELKELWTALGAEVLQRSPQDHDRALAATSHLPHVVAALLAAATDRGDLPLTAKGWGDTTRVASGDVELWRQILTENRDNVLAALGQFEAYLHRFRSALEIDDSTQIAQLLQQGKDHRDVMGS